MKAIKNVHIITVSGILENCAVVFSDNIEDIINEKDISSSMDTIDGEGNFLAPGFIDMHVHGCYGYDTMDEDENALEVISKNLVRTGVTSFLPTTMTMASGRIEDTLKRIRDKMTTGSFAKILGCHLEGPFISKKYKGAQDEKYAANPDFELIRQFADIIKVVTIAPELDGSLEFINECVKNNITVSLGHSGASFDEASSAIRSGASHLTHTFNAMTPLHHRNPGLTGAGMYHDVTCELIADNIHIHPAVQKIMLSIKGSEKIVLVTDAMRACLLKNGTYDLGGQTVYVEGKRASLIDGTIAGSVLTMNTAVSNFIENTGIPVHQAVNMASLNPARVIGICDRKGSIEKNKDADFVLLDKDFNVKMTLVSGNTVYKENTEC